MSAPAQVPRQRLQRGYQRPRSAPWRLYLLVIAIFGLSILEQPQATGGWFWDVGNAFGLLAFAGMLYLFLQVGTGRRQRIHQLMSYGFVASLLLHVIWLWAPDRTLWHYATLHAPGYMLAGLASLVLTLVIVLLALPGRRRYWHLNHNVFQKWHYYLSLCAVGLALWHLSGSGFYISRLESWLYMAVTFIVFILHRWGLTQPSTQPAVPSIHHLWVFAVMALLFVLIKLPWPVTGA